MNHVYFASLRDDNNTLYYLYKAILSVDENYVDRSGIAEKRLERVFAYELYHQWSKSIEKFNKNRESNEKFFINGETEKIMGYFLNNDDSETKYPDLILHKSINNPDGQAVVCEIKRKGNFTKGGFEEDITKLRKFVCGKQNNYKFDYGVFILVGDNMKTIFEKINLLKWTVRKREEKTDRLFLVAYDGKRIEVVSLYDALDKIERNKYINDKQE